MNIDAQINIENIETKKTRNKFVWTTFGEYEQLDEALDFLENNGFVCYDDSNLKIGQKFYFRCKKTPKTMKPYCACRYVIFLPVVNHNIITQHNGLDHDHTQRIMSDEMVEYVNKLFEKGVTQYKQIIKFIDDQRSKHFEFIDDPNPR